MASKKKPLVSKIEANDTTVLNLSKAEVHHLRDVMSVILPSEEGTSMSVSLARVKNTLEVEHGLWEKIEAACDRVGLPHGDCVQDYAIIATSSPPLAVFAVEAE